MADLNKLAGEIFGGVWDEFLGDIEGAIAQRRERTVRSLRKGDKVAIRLNAKIRPAYIKGVPLVLQGINMTTATVREIDPMAGSRFGGRPFRVHLDQLQKLEV